MGMCDGKLFFQRQKDSSRTFCNHLDLEMNLVLGKAKHLQKTSFKYQETNVRVCTALETCPSANCQDKAASISVIGFATGFPYSVCVRDCALDVAFQIAKFVAFFTVENKHEHHQTAT